MICVIGVLRFRRSVCGRVLGTGGVVGCSWRYRFEFLEVWVFNNIGRVVFIGRREVKLEKLWE